MRLSVAKAFQRCVLKGAISFSAVAITACTIPENADHPRDELLSYLESIEIDPKTDNVLTRARMIDDAIEGDLTKLFPLWDRFELFNAFRAYEIKMANATSYIADNQDNLNQRQRKAIELCSASEVAPDFIDIADDYDELFVWLIEPMNIGSGDNWKEIARKELEKMRASCNDSEAYKKYKSAIRERSISRN